MLCRADHCVVVLVGTVVVGLHLHSVLGPEHVGVLAVSQEVLVVQLQVPQCQTVLLHPQGLKLQGYRQGRWILIQLASNYINYLKYITFSPTVANN